MSAQDPSLRETNWPAVASYVSARKDTYKFIDPLKADLTGKSVLITGASKGIGKATAISFARAGCSKILLAARSDLADVELAVKVAATKANRPQPLVQSLKVDVTSEVSVQAAAEIAADMLSEGLDVLVNNAGYLSEWKSIAESDPSEWWKTWEVNIKGTYLAAHYFIPLLLKSKTKTIINISSGGVRTSRQICVVVSDLPRQRLCRSQTTYQTNGSFLGPRHVPWRISLPDNQVCPLPPHRVHGQGVP